MRSFEKIHKKILTLESRNGALTARSKRCLHGKTQYPATIMRWGIKSTWTQQFTQVKHAYLWSFMILIKLGHRELPYIISQFFSSFYGSLHQPLKYITGYTKCQYWAMVPDNRVFLIIHLLENMFFLHMRY